MLIRDEMVKTILAHITKKVPLIARLVEERDGAVTERRDAIINRDTALPARDAALSERLRHSPVSVVFELERAGNCLNEVAASRVSPREITQGQGELVNYNKLAYDKRRSRKDRHAQGLRGARNRVQYQ